MAPSPGALLQTLVAQELNAFTNQGGTMSLTMLRLSADTGPSVPTASMVRAVHGQGSPTVVALRGEADTSMRLVLCDVLCKVIALADGDVVIDLANATFINTAIVRTLAEAQRLLDRQGRALTFRSPTRLAAGILVLFGLTELIETTQPVTP